MGQSRNENILENILGASNPLGEPQSREEALLMQLLESLAKRGMAWLGVTTTELTDGATVTTITINGEDVEAKKGDIVQYDEQNYAFNGEIWQTVDILEIGNIYTKTEIDETLAPVAKSGNYNDLENKPSIPTKTSQLSNDSGFITSANVPTKTSQLQNDSGFTTIDDSQALANKAWSGQKLSGELYDEGSQYVDISLTWTEGKFYKMNGDGSSAASYKRSQLFPVTAGETLKITTMTGTNVCGIVYYNTNTASSSNFVGYDVYDSQATIKQYTDYESVVPPTATYAGVNGRIASGAQYGAKEPQPISVSKISKLNDEVDSYESSNDFEVENLERRMTTAEENNPFVWSTFDKSYFVFIHDDTNEYLETFASVFHTKGEPMGAATIPDRLTDEHIATLNQIVADGGEVLGHYSGSPTEESPDSLWLACTRDIKKALEENGFNVRGLIKADATESSTQKGEKYCRRYYDYANSHLGISEQYNLPRELMLNYSDLATFKARIDTLANVNGIHGFGFHGGRSDEAWITAETMAEIIDYINGKANCEITTYSALFDEFGSTTLNERIKALEN